MATVVLPNKPLQNSVAHKAFIPKLVSLQFSYNLAEALLQAVGGLGSCLHHIYLGLSPKWATTWDMFSWHISGVQKVYFWYKKEYCIAHLRLLFTSKSLICHWPNSLTSTIHKDDAQFHSGKVRGITVNNKYNCRSNQG